MNVLIPDDLTDMMVEIDLMSQHPQNPNNGDVDAIAESILAHGFINPVLVQRSTGHILAGNHRYAAMLALEQTKIPAVIIDVDDDEALRILIADNRTSELAIRDGHALQAILDQLNKSDIALVGTGYDDDSLAELKRINAMHEHAPIYGGPTSDYTSRPHLIVWGTIDGEENVPFDPDDVADHITELTEMGYHVTRGSL